MYLPSPGVIGFNTLCRKMLFEVLLLILSPGLLSGCDEGWIELVEESTA